MRRRSQRVNYSKTSSRMWTICAILLVLSGCEQSTELQTVSGQSLSYWLAELKQPDAKARKRALAALEGVGNSDPAAIPGIMSALKDPDATVRDRAVLALLNIGSPAHQSVPELEALKNDKNATVRAHVVKAIERVSVNH